MARSAWPTGNTSTWVLPPVRARKDGAIGRWTSKLSTGMGQPGLSSAGTARISCGFLFPCLLPSLSVPSGLRLSLWCTLNHCEEEWKFKGLPLGLLQSSLERIPYGGLGNTATQLRELPEENSNWCGCFFFI